MKIDTLVAIDTHVHIEPDSRDTAADEAARNYFGETGPSFSRQELADYYRARKIGCVVFSVDERMTGRKQVPNEDVLALAKANADVMIAFASVDPTRGADAVASAERLIASGVRGFKLHPPLQKFRANDRIAYPFYEVVAAAKLPVIFHTGHSGIGTGMPGGGGVRLKYGSPDGYGRRGRGFSGHADHPGPSLVSMAGRSHFDLPSQAPGLYRSFRVVTQVFLADPRAVRKHPSQTQNAVRFGLSADQAGPLAWRFRKNRDPRRSAAAHPERQRCPAVGTGRRSFTLLTMRRLPK